MLVLSRKVGEKIHIGDGIVVVVVKVKHNGEVRIGIDAPDDVPVHRSEVYDRIQRDKRKEQGDPD